MRTTQTEQPRNNRIELRATLHEKELLTRAAALEHMDVTGFIMRAAVPTARDVIQRTERMSLSERDTRLVLNLLENPPEPNAKLKAAAKAWNASQQK